MHFSPQTLQLLRMAGWHEGRRVDTSTMERVLRRKNYKFFPVVQDFLSQFGNLFFEKHSVKPPALEDWHFDPIEATHNRPSTHVREYESRLGEELCPIGEASRGYLIVMMTASGAVYCGYDDEFFFVAKSGADAIESFCMGRKLKKLSGAVEG